MDVEALLKRTLDLTDYQVQIYLSLLKKTGTPSQLLKRMNINRATLYRVLEELHALGLVIRHQVGKRIFYEAIHPEQLMALYNKKRISIEENAVSLQRAVYELVQRAEKKPSNTSISVEKGILAHYRSLKLQLTTKEKVIRQKVTPDASVYEYTAYPEIPEYEKFIRTFIKERVSKDIFMKQIIHAPFMDKFGDLYVSSRDMLKEVRILPAEILPNISFKVFDSYTILTIHSKVPEDITIITIRDQLVAELMKSLFDFVFDRSVISEKRTPLPTVTTKENRVLPKIGIGTSGVGGYWNKLHSYTDDIGDVDQVRHAISRGMTYIDCCLMYGEGHAVEIVGKAIKNIPRNALFITGKLTRPGNKLVSSEKDIEDQCNRYLKVLGVEYIDQFQIHSASSLAIPEDVVVGKIGELISSGKVRHWGVGNYKTVDDLTRVQSYIKEPLFGNEIPYGVYAREYERSGVVEYMRKQKILTIAYFTVKRGGMLTDDNNTTDYILELSKKYEKTPVQIALQWIAHHPYTMAIVKSTNGTHINENAQALDFELSASEYKKISDLY